MTQDSDDPRLPDSLIDDLSRAYRTDLRVPPEIDRVITSGARAHLARGGRLWLWLRVGGVAAAIVIVATVLTIHRSARQIAAVAEDINHDGVVDIRDAMALQQALNRGSRDGHDVNHDGVTDGRDVDAVAMMAVRLDRGATR